MQRSQDVDMKTKSIYIAGVFLLLIIAAIILYYIFYNGNSDTVFDGTFVNNMKNTCGGKTVTNYKELFL